MRIKRRHLRDTEDPFSITDTQFIANYRITKAMVREIVQTLQPHADLLVRRTGIPFHLKLLATLSFLATGSYQKPVGCSAWTCLSQPMISRSISVVCRLITTILMPNQVRFPTDQMASNVVKHDFYRKWGLRGIIGAIDGTHVEIKAPSVTDEQHPPFVYLNRKGRHSVNVMVICDSNGKFIGCDARFPGSTHDAAVWQVSDIRNYLRTRFNNGDINTRLIGDSGYGVEPWLFTPVGNAAADTPEARFNEALRTARNVIERAIGILKTRFRCLLQHRVLHYHPVKAALIIYAGIVMHNMALDAGLPDPEPIELNDDNDQMNVAADNNVHIVANINNIAIQGRARRAEYIRINHHNVI